MPIEVTWYIPNRVILARGQGTVTKEENAESDRQVAEFIQQGTPPVHVIIDVTNVDDFPFFTANYQAGNVQQFLRSDKLGWAVLTGTNNTIVRFMAGIIIRVTNVRFKMFTTFEEAIVFLQENDSTVPWNTTGS